jgi:ribonuclease E
VFAVHRIDEQLTKALDRKVWLPSGGTLVIDRTEAMTVVDVNTGKFTGSGGNLEQTVTRNNLEAAEEIVRQLRLRDIGGIVVIDFIDMVLESNRDLVLRRLTEALARDRTRHQVSEVTSLGLVQLTRKRLGTGLIEAFSTPCPHCAGRGILLHGDPVDSTSTGRKSDSGGRRGKRGKKGGRVDDVEVAKVPAHPAGEHPMFKAMAAANGRHDAEDTDGEVEEKKTAEEVAELDPDTIRQAYVEAEDEELEDEDFDDEDESAEDEDEDESDEDEIDLDADDEDDDIDDDIEVINGDSDDDSDDEDYDDESDDEDDSDEDDSDNEDDDLDEPPAAVPPGGRHRRRAAARPAGPPIHES